MAVRIRARTEGMRQTRRYLRQMEKRAEDFRPVLRWAQRELEEAYRENFRTGGVSSGRPWMPLDNEYARWKLANYGPLPKLVREGDLFRDVTFLKGPPNRIGKTSATFGTDLEYAEFHQVGTRNMPARPIIFTPRGFANELGGRIARYVVSGNQTGVGLRTLRNVFRR